MVQTLHGLIAIALVMLLSLNLMRTLTGTQRKMAINEVATQITGIAVDLMEHVGNQWFDEETNEDGVDASDFPLVQSRSELTPAASPEWGACAALTDLYHIACDDIDDFDGMTLERDVEGLPYTADITVRYVLETDPGQPTAGNAPSYAKEIIIEITTPFLLFNDNPLEVTISRVITYKRIT